MTVCCCGTCANCVREWNPLELRGGGLDFPDGRRYYLVMERGGLLEANAQKARLEAQGRKVRVAKALTGEWQVWATELEGAA